MLTVVIPTQDSERTLLPTLAALVPGATATLIREVIVADGGSRDGTALIAEGAGCELVVFPGAPEQRMRAAAAKARAPWLMFLPSGAVPDPNWVTEVSRFIETAELRGLAASRAAAFRKASDGEPSALAEALALIRLAFGGRPRPEQGLIIHRQLYDSIGGHDAAAAGLAKRLGRKRIVLLRAGIVTVSEGAE